MGVVARNLKYFRNAFMKKVSIITITYNLLKNGRPDFFETMFTSLHNQTYPNIEHVIIDGASTDGSQEFIKQMITKYGKKEVTFISEPDNGIEDATNKGWTIAKGDYLMLMCSDDYYMREDAVELLVNACEKKNADFACGDCWWLEKKVWKAKPNSFVYQHPFLINTLLMKKEIFNDIGGLSDEFGIASDYEFFYRLLTKYTKAAVVHKTITALRPGGVSSNHRKDKRIVKSYYKIFKKYYNYPFTKKEMNCLISSYEYKYSVGLIQILKMLFLMENNRLKWMLIRHYNIFYYIKHKIYQIISKIYNFIKLIYLITNTDIL